MTQRCGINGTLIRDDHRDGNGCPDHTSLIENGGNQTAEHLVAYYQEHRHAYPTGRYCCGFCHAPREEINDASTTEAEHEMATESNSPAFQEQCENCRKAISPAARACPACGHPVHREYHHGTILPLLVGSFFLFDWLYDIENTSSSAKVVYTVLGSITVAIVGWITANSRTPQEADRVKWALGGFVVVVAFLNFQYDLGFYDLVDAAERKRRFWAEASPIGAALLVGLATGIVSFCAFFILVMMNPHLSKNRE